MIKILIFAVVVFCWNPVSSSAFTFDDWHSGMTLDEVLDISEKKDLPINRYGLVIVNKHFDPKTSRAYADRASTFYYKTTLASEPAKVTLRFTEESRLLYEVKVHWQGINVKKGLVPTVEDMLQKKYGKPTKSRKFFSKDKIWHLDKDNRLVMENSGAALQLVYIDLVLEKTALHEKKKSHKSEDDRIIRNDLDKF